MRPYKPLGLRLRPFTARIQRYARFGSFGHDRDTSANSVQYPSLIWKTPVPVPTGTTKLEDEFDEQAEAPSDLMAILAGHAARRSAEEIAPVDTGLSESTREEAVRQSDNTIRRSWQPQAEVPGTNFEPEPKYVMPDQPARRKRSSLLEEITPAPSTESASPDEWLTSEFDEAETLKLDMPPSPSDQAAADNWDRQPSVESHSRESHQVSETLSRSAETPITSAQSFSPAPEVPLLDAPSDDWRTIEPSDTEVIDDSRPTANLFSARPDRSETTASFPSNPDTSRFEVIDTEAPTFDQPVTPEDEAVSFVTEVLPPPIESAPPQVHRKILDTQPESDVPPSSIHQSVTQTEPAPDFDEPIESQSTPEWLSSETTFASDDISSDFNELGQGIEEPNHNTPAPALPLLDDEGELNDTSLMTGTPETPWWLVTRQVPPAPDVSGDSPKVVNTPAPRPPENAIRRRLSEQSDLAEEQDQSDNPETDHNEMPMDLYEAMLSSGFELNTPPYQPDSEAHRDRQIERPVQPPAHTATENQQTNGLASSGSRNAQPERNIQRRPSEDSSNHKMLSLLGIPPDTPVEGIDIFQDKDTTPSRQESFVRPPIDEALASRESGLQPISRMADESPAAEPPSTPAKDSGGEKTGGSEVDVEKLARDVFGVLRDRLRIEMERRSGSSQE